MRVFFGIPIPEARAKAFRALIIEENPKITHRVRWVKAGKQHITLRFLGNVAEQKVPVIVNAVKQSIRGINPFTVTLRNITGFPGPHARIVAVNVQPSLELQTLYDAVDLAIVSNNFPPEKRIYRPHITLLKPVSTENLQFESISLNNEQLEVKELILYQSIPVERGNLYVPLNRFSFEE